LGHPHGFKKGFKTIKNNYLNQMQTQRILRFFCMNLTIALCLGCGSGERGCTDPNSLRYQPDATEDDGSCSYPEPGRTPLFLFFSQSNNANAGTFGIPIFEKMVAEFGSSCFPIMVYPQTGDPLFSGTAVSLQSAMQTTFLPGFSLGNQTNLLTEQAIRNGWNIEQQQTADASADGRIFSIVQDSLEVEFNGVFHAPSQGQFFANILLVEKNVPQAQAGIPNPGFVHPYVLRSSGASGGLGFQIATGNVPEGHSFRRKFKIPIQPGWSIGKLTACTIIWKIENGQAQFVNARLIPL
jgi:hypothetical protein